MKRSIALFGLMAAMISYILPATIHARPDTSPRVDSPVALNHSMTESETGGALEILTMGLQSAAHESSRFRRILGYTLLGFGSVSGLAGGTAILITENSGVRIAGYAFLGGGLLLGGLSAIPLLYNTEPERVYKEISKLPDQTQEQRLYKLLYGDRRFEELAEKYREQRYIIGGVLILGGLTNQFVLSGYGEMRFGATLAPMLAGSARILFKTTTERRFETYRRARQDLSMLGGNNSLIFNASPLPEGGIAASLLIQF